MLSAQQKFPPNFSFELFPPRTENGKIKCQETATKLAALNPEYFSVTFGAGGSSQDATVETVQMLEQQTGIPTAPHISCIGSSKESVLSLLHKYQEMNIKRLVALRGDLPSGMLAPGEFKYANELIEFIRTETGDSFHIEVAAYPEFHPQAPNAMQDMENFKRKVMTGANSAITQYFYNAAAYYRFVEQCTKMGVDIPIVPGIMPITNHQQLARFSDNCGAEIPRWLRKRLACLEDTPEAIIEFGKDVVIDLCSELLSQGAPGLHFYTLNNLEPTLSIWQALDLSNHK